MPLLENDAAAVVHQTRCRTYRFDGIVLAHQTESADYGVHRFVDIEILQRSGTEVDVLEAFRLSSAVCQIDVLQIGVYPDNPPIAPNALGDEQRELRKVGAGDEDPHSGCDARACEQLLGK